MPDARETVEAVARELIEQARTTDSKVIALPPDDIEALARWALARERRAKREVLEGAANECDQRWGEGKLTAAGSILRRLAAEVVADE